MKTLKALKITSVLQIIYCFCCIIFIISIKVNHFYSISVIRDIVTFIRVLTTFGWLINPIGIISFIICLLLFLTEHKHKENKQLIGKKWIWIFIWPVITAIFYLISLGELVVFAGV